MPSHTIVILIDHKGRDLMGAALIAHHLKRFGIETHLEPLEAWRASITAWKPCMIIVNQLVFSNMTAFTAQLHKWGILVGVLLNEGLCLTDSNRLYHSKPQYNDTHCDLFLTWNTLHRDELIRHKLVTPPENAIVTGCPRFDFYKSPWSQVFRKNHTSERTNLLLNTTFAVAHFFNRSEKDQAKLFNAMGNGQISETLDYKTLIKAHRDGMLNLPNYLKVLLDSEKFNITLRPHPREELTFYNEFIAELPENQRKFIRLDKKEPIQSAILNADIILNCEDCTTSVESWIANKPTITLTFAKNPVFFTPTYADRSPQVSEPALLMDAIEHALKHPNQEKYSKLREEYLHKWLYKVDGKSALRAAKAIQQTIQDKSPVPQFPKDFSNIRRGLKLRLLHLLNEPAHAKPSQIIRRKIQGENGKQSLRYRDYLKAVTPKEAAQAVHSIQQIVND